ncbi:DinB family protein [Flavobacterium piscinae]|uniref:DinB family protein n=1 Tax=Flavobacterium piscinae TaxID=2506424 RepID=A0A4Q1KJT9_9FLAO|nr:DinB family protein [Flavobacterium piscinae]RXR30113.1 DinB family protein [Flavobacterium piscinae]
MVTTIKKLEELITQLQKYVSETSEAEISNKPNTEKWSKKEILGHLVDSGIYNIQRFTEIQFKEQSYRLQNYNQDELVKANSYQNSSTNDILDLLCALNKRIIELIKFQDHLTLKNEIILSSGEIINFKFLIEDYVIHFEHHTKQIVE